MKRKVARILVLIFALILISSPVYAKNLINDTVTVPLYSFKILDFETVQNQVKIQLQIEVSPGPIHLLVLDENNYGLWLSTAPYQYYLSENIVDTGKFTVTLGQSGKYYVVIDNVFQPYAQIVRIKVSTLSIGEIIGIAIGATIGIGVIIYGSIWFYKKKVKKNST